MSDQNQRPDRDEWERRVLIVVLVLTVVAFVLTFLLFLFFFVRTLAEAIGGWLWMPFVEAIREIGEWVLTTPPF